MILLPSFRRISSARAAPTVMNTDRRASATNNLPRMISSMAKPGIEQQASAAGKFPVGHPPSEYLKSLTSSLKPPALVCGPDSGGKFLHGDESKFLVKAHGMLVA